VELGCDKYPPASSLAKEWERNRTPMIEYMWRVHSGVKGVVKDDKDVPIGEAVIRVKNVTSGRNQDIDHEVTSLDKSGEFWRLLTPGHYEVTVSKEGFLPLTKMVTVADNGHEEAKRVDFVLTPAGLLEDKSAATDLTVDSNEKGALPSKEDNNNINNNIIDQEMNSYDFSNPELLDWTRVLAGKNYINSVLDQGVEVDQGQQQPEEEEEVAHANQQLLSNNINQIPMRKFLKDDVFMNPLFGSHRRLGFL
jgi:hypothetical protein